MTKVLAALLMTVSTCGFALAQPNLPRQRLSFNTDWRFQKGDVQSAQTPAIFVDKWRWKSGNDLAILTQNTAGADWKDATAQTDVFGAQPGFAWFRTTLASSTKPPLVLKFSGADDNATVYWNGQKIGSHQGWGQPFEIALPAWKPNAPGELAVLVENVTGPGGIGRVELHEKIAPVAAKSDFNDSKWRVLNLPHDWGIEGPFQQELEGETGKLPWAGVGWYRKSFAVPANERGRKFTLEIDGAMSFSTVYLNGHEIGGWPYGYSSYQLDLTPHLRFGAQNVLAIRLDNLPNSSRWYPGGGIYRNVWLTKTGPVRVAQWGTQVTTPQISAQKATVKIAVQIEKPQNAAPVAVRVEVFARGAGGQKTGTVLARTQTTASASTKSELSLEVQNPRLWNTKNPHLYLAETSLLQAGKVVDTYQTTFGIRAIKWDAKQGFLLNGERVPLQGVCLHHDLGALGAAFNTRAQERQLEIMQSMGVNAIRTSHNPPAPEFLDLCDQMGILVIDEFSDTWKWAKKPNGYAKIWNDWAEKDVRALVRRDRNHPSIIAWSSGNEVAEQSPGEGHKISRFLTDLFHSEDPTRPVTSGNNYPDSGENGFQNTNDVFGYNYKPHLYARFRAANPQIPIYGSETASTISSRGEYFFPVTEGQGEGKSDFQVSSYDLYAPGWATPPDREFRGLDENPFVAGEFVWTGFDYLGEPTPYNNDTTNLLNFRTPEERARAEEELKNLGKLRVPSRSSYFGIVDLAGFPKDRFYLYQARWRPNLPIAHILPHWNWPERVGEITPVHVYTSGDEAELWLNGKSQGRKKRGQFDYRLRWNEVRYEPGELRVVAYKNGKQWATSSTKTTGEAAKLTLEADRLTIENDGVDLSFITARVVDDLGRTVPRSRQELQFFVDGPGEIIATDNGNPIDLTNFNSPSRRAFNGLALVIVRAKRGQSGRISVRAQSTNLVGCEIAISAR